MLMTLVTKVVNVRLFLYGAALAGVNTTVTPVRLAGLIGARREGGRPGPWGKPGRAPSPGSARALTSWAEQPLSPVRGAAGAGDGQCMRPRGRAVPGACRQQGHSDSGVCRGPEEGAGRISHAAAHPAAALPLPQMPSFVLSPSQGRCTGASPPAGERGGAGLGIAGIPASPDDTGAAPLPGCCGAAAHGLGSIVGRPGRMDGRTDGSSSGCGGDARAAGPGAAGWWQGDTGRGTRSAARAQQTQRRGQAPVDLVIAGHRRGSQTGTAAPWPARG